MKKSKLSDYMKPSAKQKELLSYIGLGYDVFFGGSRGGGKTHGSRMCAVRTARMYPGISIVCIRRTYDELKEWNQ